MPTVAFSNTGVPVASPFATPTVNPLFGQAAGLLGGLAFAPPAGPVTNTPAYNLSAILGPPKNAQVQPPVGWRDMLSDLYGIRAPRVGWRDYLSDKYGIRAGDLAGMATGPLMFDIPGIGNINLGVGGLGLAPAGTGGGGWSNFLDLAVGNPRGYLGSTGGPFFGGATGSFGGGFLQNPFDPFLSGNLGSIISGG